MSRGNDEDAGLAGIVRVLASPAGTPPGCGGESRQ